MGKIAALLYRIKKRQKPRKKSSRRRMEEEEATARRTRVLDATPRVEGGASAKVEVTHRPAKVSDKPIREGGG